MASSQSEYHTFVWKGDSDLALTQWSVTAQIVQMSLGTYHSAFLTEDKRVLCCGKNSMGQLGIGDDEGTVLEPVHVTALESKYPNTFTNPHCAILKA